MALEGNDEATGFRALAERARALCTREPSRLVVAVLSIALAGTAAQQSYDLYRTIRDGRVTPAPAISGAVHPGLSIGAIANANLFGVSATAAAGRQAQPVSTNLTFVLTGVIAMTDPAAGYALIGPAGQTAHFREAGTAVVEGVLLRAVYPDHVEIERAGRVEIVQLPHSTLVTGSLARIGAPQIGTSSAQQDSDSESEQVAQTAEVVKRLSTESDRLAAIMHVEPNLGDGTFRGIVVQPGADPSLLGRLGLRAGDLIRGVNGVLIGGADRVDLLRKALDSGEPVQISLTRGGEGPEEITVDSRLVAGLASN